MQHPFSHLLNWGCAVSSLALLIFTASNWEKQPGQDDFLERFQLVPTPWLRNSKHLPGIRDSTICLPSAQEGGNLLLH